METTEYKAMIALSRDERRALNTLAAIASLTPNRYVEQVLTDRLREDCELLGLDVPARVPVTLIPGQLQLPSAPIKVTHAKPKRPAKPKKESPRRRRTVSEGGR